MDTELLELQKLFAATQESKPTLRLSERNVVELVSKLKQLQLLDSDLLHTVTGKEYITKERLKAEVEANVVRSGRISLIDLADSIQVELVHCERVAEQIAADHSELVLIQGEIISDAYLDTVAEEVNEALQESGQISLGELATRYNVGVELLTSALESRIQRTLIRGKLEAGQLYTPAFVARIRAMIRGAVIALTIPTPLSEVWSALQREFREGDDSSGSIVPGLFQTVLNEIIAAGEVKGTLRGGGASWRPAVFAQSQRESVEAFFSQNGYISYDFLRKLVISQPKFYLQDKYPDGTALETVFVHTSVISVLDAAADEAINGGAWVDLVSLVPPLFTSSDIAMLVHLCSSVQKAIKESTGLVLSETCVVSMVFVKTLREKLEVEVRALAENDSKEVSGRPGQSRYEGSNSENGASSSSTLVAYDKEADRKDEITHGKNSKKKRGGQPASRERAKENGEEFGTKGAKSKRRAGRNKGGISQLAGETGVGTNNSGRGSFAKDHTNEPSQELLTDKICEWYPDMEGAGTDGSDSGECGPLVKALAEWLRPSMLSTWTAAKSASFTQNSEERRRRMDDLQGKIDEVYANLQLFEKAADLFEDDSGTSAILQRHILRTTATEIVDLFLSFLNLENVTESGSTETGQSLSSREALTSEQRQSLARNMPGPTLSTMALALLEAIEGKSVQVFVSALEAAVTESGLRLKKLDKKLERSLLHSHRKVLTSEVDEEEDPVALLPKVVSLLFIQVHNRALQAPGRAMAAAVAHLGNGLSDENFRILVDYHKTTVQVLSMQATVDPDANECTNDRLRTKRELLVERMPRLKSVAISPQGSGRNISTSF